MRIPDKFTQAGCSGHLFNAEGVCCMCPGLDALTWWVYLTIVGIKDMCSRGVGEGKGETGELVI